MNVRKPTFSAILTAIAFALPIYSWAEDWSVPARTNPRPLTTDNVPHVQIDVEIHPELTAELLKRVATIPDVEIRETVISLPGAKGFWLNDDISLARPDAIVGGREFAHVHPDGSLHASLPEDFANLVAEAGWAVKHPWADRRPGWEGFVMIYTAQSEEELDVVYQLILASYNFVTGRNIAGSSGPE